MCLLMTNRFLNIFMTLLEEKHEASQLLLNKHFHKLSQEPITAFKIKPQYCLTQDTVNFYNKYTKANAELEINSNSFKERSSSEDSILQENKNVREMIIECSFAGAGDFINPYRSAINKLKEIPRLLSPVHKLKAITKCVELVHNCA